MDNKIQVDSVILMYAFRYALTRLSGCVYDVVTELSQNVNNIGDKYKAVIVSKTIQYLERVREIEEEGNKEFYPHIIKSWKDLVILFYSKLSNESKDWLTHPLGGGLEKDIVDNYKG